MFANDPFTPSTGDVNPLDGTGFQGGDASSLSRNWGKIKSAGDNAEIGEAAGATNTLRPLTHSLEPTKEGSAVHATQIQQTRPVSEDEARPYVVEMLDAIRRQQESLNVNKPRFMLLARQYGMKHAEIAELLGMTESGVRQAVRRAKNTPGMEFGGAA